MLVEADLHSIYGIDIESGVLKRRSWRWLSVRIGGCCQDPHSRIARRLAPPPDASASEHQRRG